VGQGWQRGGGSRRSDCLFIAAWPLLPPAVYVKACAAYVSNGGGGGEGRGGSRGGGIGTRGRGEYLVSLPLLQSH
jgi:hypothetical protein